MQVMGIDFHAGSFTAAAQGGDGGCTSADVPMGSWATKAGHETSIRKHEEIE